MADTGVNRRSIYETRSKNFVNRTQVKPTSSIKNTETPKVKKSNSTRISSSFQTKSSKPTSCSTPNRNETEVVIPESQDLTASSQAEISTPRVIPETQETEDELSFMSTAAHSNIKATLNRSLTFSNVESFVKIIEERDRLKQEVETIGDENAVLKTTVKKLEEDAVQMSDIIVTLTEELERIKMEEVNLMRTVGVLSDDQQKKPSSTCLGTQPTSPAAFTKIIQTESPRIGGNNNVELIDFDDSDDLFFDS